MITKGARLFHTFHIEKESAGTKYMMGHLGIEKMHAQSKRTLYSGQAFPMTFVRLEKMWKFVKQVPRQLNQLEMSVMFHLMHGTLWAPTCSIGNKIDCLVVGDYFSK